MPPPGYAYVMVEAKLYYCIDFAVTAQEVTVEDLIGCFGQKVCA